MILLQVDGKDYTDFETITIEKSMESFTGEFNFLAVSDISLQLPFDIGDTCRVLVDGDPIITGFVEIISKSYTDNTHTINISGRDKTADLSDSSIGQLDDITGNINLKGLCERILKHLGITNIKVIDNTGGIKNFNDAEDKISPQPGDNAFDFLEGWARKRQVLLNTDGDGNLSLVKNIGNQESQTFQNVANNLDSNNILSASSTVDLSEIYNKYLLLSQKNTSIKLDLAPSPSEIVDQPGDFIDKFSRVGRQMVVNSETSSSSGENFDRAKWEADIRRSKAVTIKVKVQGHSNESGQTYKINNLITIADDFLNERGTFLIEGITYSLGNDTGNITEFNLVNKDSFTLKLLTPESSQSKSSTSIQLNIPSD